MNFWERVENLIEQKGINKKTLASETGIDSSSISKGLKNGSFPSAETAVKIAKFLNTSVEYLVTGIDSQLSDSRMNQLDTLLRYSKTVKNLDNLPPKIRKPIETMISEIGK
ncbi:MAG: helix-turn-helix transcriptional regulator [Spirochaetia bacterium]|nr:helix-turn-helix transcriptional regulator [Spirochaetia bacterium]MBR5017203.1 helix-turn-helix transcriptional regulator [Spirochaetia bacterium]